MTGNIHGHNELHMTQLETTSEVTASVNFLILCKTTQHCRKGY